MRAAELEAALGGARGAVLSAADPDAALARLQRFVRREHEFAGSPAAMTDDERAAALGAGASLGDAASSAAAVRSSVARGLQKLLDAEVASLSIDRQD